MHRNHNARKPTCQLMAQTTKLQATSTNNLDLPSRPCLGNSSMQLLHLLIFQRSKLGNSTFSQIISPEEQIEAEQSIICR